MIVARIVIIGVLASFLSACTPDTPIYAPVRDANVIEPIPKNGKHQVRRGETVYAVAWRYGLDYRTLTKRNKLHQPYHVAKGQTLYLRDERAKSHFIAQKKSPLPEIKVSAWQWPAHGPILQTFSEQSKGIDIGGYLGDPIYAAAAGKVVYSGNGLRSYGKLIIVKHNSQFLTAYAHNKVLYVKDGDLVKKGQKIAAMGDTGTKKTMLHFEIRRSGIPVNPLMYLVKR